MIQEDSPDWSIEWLRGIAALLVVLAHYGPLVVGDLGILKIAHTGVDLFFVLSGYVFGPYFFGRPLDFRPFAVRRIFRIFPMYWAALAFYVGVKLAYGLETPYLPEHLFLFQTLVSTEIAFYYNAAFWSLPVELEYYLFLALLAPLLQGQKRLGILVLLAFGMHQAVVLALPPASAGNGISWAGILFFHLPGMLVEFLVGAAAWRVTALWSPGSFTRWTLIFLAGLSLLALGWLFRDHAELFDAGPLRGNLNVLAALAYGFLVVGLAKRPEGGPFAVRAGLVLGNLSYGVYLFHNLPLSIHNHGGHLDAGQLSALRAISLFGAVLLLAVALNRLVEKPCRRLGRSLAVRLAQ